MNRQFTTESFDKFTNAKTISTIRHKKFGGWTETHEPNQSVLLFKNDMAMPSLNIDFEVRLFATAVNSASPNGDEIYIEFLNYFKDSHADKGSNAQNFSQSSMDLVIDNENISIKAGMINDGENRFARSGLVNKDIFTRNQLLKFAFTKDQFTKLCDGKNIHIRISGVQNPVRLSNNDKNIHEFDANAVRALQNLCQQLYNESIQEGKYAGLSNTAPKAASSGKSGGCFIATAAMGDYDHPVVMDLRMFRDNWLLKRDWGVRFTSWYYTHGPKAAKVIDKSTLLKKITFVAIVKPLQIITKKLR